MPTSGIEQITVITGGVPAKYGDATGGIISVTTKGPSSKMVGGIRAMKLPHCLMSYNYNLLGFATVRPYFKKEKY